MKSFPFLPLGTLTALLLALGTGCATTDFVTGKSVNNAYTLDEDIQLGKGFHAETLSQLKKDNQLINQDPGRLGMVRAITGRIAAVSDLPDLPYEITFVGDPKIINAYAFPGGNIMVFEGLWDSKEGLVQTLDELAAVIAHEIAHVTCRHATEEMTREMIPNLAIAGGMIWATLEEDKDLQLLFAGIAVVHNGLIVTRYSRKDELEADRIGMMYMAKAGYDPAAAPRVWDRLAAASDSQMGKALSIFSTHPRDFLRSQELRKHLPEAQALYEAAPVKHKGTRKLSELPPLVTPEK